MPIFCWIWLLPPSDQYFTRKQQEASQNNNHVSPADVRPDLATAASECYYQGLDSVSSVSPSAGNQRMVVKLKVQGLGICLLAILSALHDAFSSTVIAILVITSCNLLRKSSQLLLRQNDSYSPPSVIRPSVSYLLLFSTLPSNLFCKIILFVKLKLFQLSSLLSFFNHFISSNVNVSNTKY